MKSTSLSLKRSVQIVAATAMMNTSLISGAWAQNAAQTAPPAFSIDQYLGEVQTQNQNFLSADVNQQSYTLRADEFRLTTAPRVFADATFVRDRRETQNPTFQGRENRVQLYNFGYMQTTDFGMTAKLYYQIQRVELFDVNRQFINPPKFYNTSPVAEINASLWRNFGGAETKALMELSKAQVLSDTYNNSYNRSMLLQSAEISYWKLAVARESLQNAKENLDRAKKMTSWASRRTNLQLSDKGDLYQAQAAEAARELEYMNAINAERMARMNFNLVRGIENEEVTASLARFDMKAVEKLEAKTELVETLNLKTRAQQVRLARARSIQQSEALKPDLNVFASMSFNGRDGLFDPSFQESFSSKNPYYTVGLKFNMPIDGSLFDKNKQAYSVSAGAAERAYQQAALENKMMWYDLIKRFNESKLRLKQIYEIQNARERQLTNARELLSRGRTTTAQVLLFESDYANAQLSRIQTLNEVLSLYAQIKNQVIMPQAAASNAAQTSVPSGAPVASAPTM